MSFVDGRKFTYEPTDEREKKMRSVLVGREAVLLRPVSLAETETKYVGQLFWVSFEGIGEVKVFAKDLKGFDGSLLEPLYWVDRNEEGLYESGYLLNRALLEEDYKHFTDEDYALMDKGESVEGAFWGDDTFTVSRVFTYEEVFNKLTWQGFELTESYAASGCGDELEYPDFVDKKYRYGEMFVYELTGYTCKETLGGDYNPVFDLYSEVFALKPEDLEYQPTTEELITYEIGQIVHDENQELTLYDYCKILHNHRVFDSKIHFAIIYPEDVQKWSDNNRERGSVYEEEFTFDTVDDLKAALEAGDELDAEATLSWYSVPDKEWYADKAGIQIKDMAKWYGINMSEGPSL